MAHHGFLLTLSVVIPTTGYLLQRFAHRSLFFFAILSFILGTAIAVLAPSFAFLLLARIIQAVGTAIILPLLMTTTLALVPVRQRGTVMGLNSIVIGVGPAIGPTASGAVVHALDWHYIFILMLPIAVAVLVLGAIFFRDPFHRTQDQGGFRFGPAIRLGFRVPGVRHFQHRACRR